MSVWLSHQNVRLGFNSGPVGLVISEQDGRVTYVAEDGQGQELGVKVGWRIEKINGNRYTSELVSSDPSIALPSQTQKKMFDSGPLGLMISKTDGRVTYVVQGFQGDEHGVKVGWEIEQINGKSYTSDMVSGADSGSEVLWSASSNIEVAFKDPSTTSEILWSIRDNVEVVFKDPSVPACTRKNKTRQKHHGFLVPCCKGLVERYSGLIGGSGHYCQ
jgi:hypothetical protein